MSEAAFALVCAMKNFSMYEHAIESAGGTVEQLGSVTYISRRDYDERTTIHFRAQVPCLEYVSLLIENSLLLRTHRGGRVYAGFQKLSRMEGVVDRYMRIADLSERTYVFGEPDWMPPRHPNMRVIPLAADSRLAREWFVIASSPKFGAALVGIDEEGFSTPVLEARHFRAFKTNAPGLVERLAAAAENIVDNAMRI